MNRLVVYYIELDCCLNQSEEFTLVIRSGNCVNRLVVYYIELDCCCPFFVEFLLNLVKNNLIICPMTLTKLNNSFV